MAVQIRKASKTQSRLRLALDGPAGSGKTYTGLRFAFALASSYDKVLVVDTEHETAAKYIGEDPDGLGPWPEFDTVSLSEFNPQNYIDAIEAGEAGGYEVILLDSISHAWEGEGGVLDLHDKATKRSGSGNSFTAWKDVTPIHRHLVEAMLQSSCHIIATMRSKVEYIQTQDDKGRTVIKKVGMAPIQRQGIDYEFDIVADMDVEHNMVISKTRCSRISDAVVNKPGAKWFATVKAWLSEGTPPPTIIKRQAPPAASASGNGTSWTKVAEERAAFKAFLEGHGVTDHEAKQILGQWLKLPGPLALYGEWPHGRQRAQRVLLGWLMANRPADPETHWMKTDEKERAAFWARMGEQGLDEVAVHERVPRTSSFPGTPLELEDMVLHSTPEDRWQLPLEVSF